MALPGFPWCMVWSAACPWAVSWQSGSSIVGSAGPGCWSLAAGSYTDSGVTAPASLELPFCKCSWKIMPEATDRDLTLQQVEVSSHSGFKNHESVPPMTWEAKKVPDLERYVGGYIYMCFGFPACVHYQAFLHKHKGQACRNRFPRQRWSSLQQWFYQSCIT